MGICGVAVLMFFYCGDAVNKISIRGVAVIANPSVCDVCVCHLAVFGEMKLFAVVWFLVWSFSDINFKRQLRQSLAAFRVDFSVMFMDFHTKELSQ